MQVTVMKPVQVEIRYIEIEVPVRYGTEQMSEDFPFRKGDMWRVIVNIDTGKIQDWPAGVSRDLSMKVVDGGSYRLMDADRGVVAAIEQDYVPHSVVPGEYGDYIELDIQEDGTIANWPNEPVCDVFWEE